MAVRRSRSRRPGLPMGQRRAGGSRTDESLHFLPVARPWRRAYYPVDRNQHLSQEDGMRGLRTAAVLITCAFSAAACSDNNNSGTGGAGGSAGTGGAGGSAGTGGSGGSAGTGGTGGASTKNGFVRV